MVRLLGLAGICISLTACAVQRGAVHQAPTDVAPAQDEGAVLLELIHVAHESGPGFDDLSTLRVASGEEKDKYGDPVLYALTRIAGFGNDTAVYAGVLPKGFYRLHEVLGVRADGVRPWRYWSAFHLNAAEFFVAAGKMNVLGTYLHSALGSASWLIHKQPTFDLRERAASQRPDLAILQLPGIASGGVDDVEKIAYSEEERSIFETPFPTTQLFPIGEDGLLLGAQLGYIYYRQPFDADSVLRWKAYRINTLESVTDIDTIDDYRFYATLANGEVFRLDLRGGDPVAQKIDVPGGVIGFELDAGTAFAVSTRHDSKRSTSEDPRIDVIFSRKTAGTWETFAEFETDTLPQSVLLVDGEIHVTLSNEVVQMMPWEVDMLRVDIASGEIFEDEAPAVHLNKIGNGYIASSSGSLFRPQEMHIFYPGRDRWDNIPRVNLAAWPFLSPEDDLRLLGVPVAHLPEYMNPFPWILRPTRARKRWEAMSYLPAYCAGYRQARFVDESLVTVCGEQVLTRSPDGDWVKEALHEAQTYLR